jgi:hypothetical protein
MWSFVVPFLWSPLSLTATFVMVRLAEVALFLGLLSILTVLVVEYASLGDRSSYALLVSVEAAVRICGRCIIPLAKVSIARSARSAFKSLLKCHSN